MPETVHHPAHYGGDTTYETVKVIEAWGLNFALGNTVKYISRAGKKNGAGDLEDLRKAAWYLNREIQRREQNLSEGVGGGGGFAEVKPDYLLDRDGDTWSWTDKFGGGWYLAKTKIGAYTPTSGSDIWDLEGVTARFGPLTPVAPRIKDSGKQAG